MPDQGAASAAGATLDAARWLGVGMGSALLAVAGLFVAVAPRHAGEFAGLAPKDGSDSATLVRATGLRSGAFGALLVFAAGRSDWPTMRFLALLAIVISTVDVATVRRQYPNEPWKLLSHGTGALASVVLLWLMRESRATKRLVR